jgi:hypothetical protein
MCAMSLQTSRFICSSDVCGELVEFKFDMLMSYFTSFDMVPILRHLFVPWTVFSALEPKI